MRSLVMLIAALPTVRLFELQGGFVQRFRVDSKTATSPTTRFDGTTISFTRSCGGCFERRGTRRRSRSDANMDDSDDTPDEEIYASLRRRLEELERSDPPVSDNNDPLLPRRER